MSNNIDNFTVSDVWNENKDGIWTISDESFTKYIPVTDWMNWGAPHGDKGMTTTKIYKFEVDDNNFKIQLWKGFYPLMPPLLPFACGAEVGIYLEERHDVWMPAPEYKANIEYTLKDKKTGMDYFSLKNKTWWLNGWKGVENDLDKAKGASLTQIVTLRFDNNEIQKIFEEKFGIKDGKIVYDGTENMEYTDTVNP